jgi:TolA-binding protein
MSADSPIVGGEESLDDVERELLRGEGARLGSDIAGVNREAAMQVVDRFRAGERRRKVMYSAAAAASLAAAAALALGLSRNAAEQPPLATASAFQVESGVAREGAHSMSQGAAVAANSVVSLTAGTCLRAEAGVRLCSAKGAKLKLPARGAAWDVLLTAGGITAEVEPIRAGFTIGTRHGTASVVGTKFQVELDAALTFTTVFVEHGRVRVQRIAGEEAALSAGEQAVLSDRFPLSLGSREPTPAPQAAVAPADQAPPPEAATKHEVPEARAAAPKDKTASALLEEARQQRGNRHYAQAAQLYRKLVQQHPESVEARAALVSLGQLELGQLGQPEAALRSFQAYLAHPGQLRQEAEHGVIQALQRLGRKAEERRAIEAFLARYPKSTQAGPLGERLKQL